MLYYRITRLDTIRRKSIIWLYHIALFWMDYVPSGRSRSGVESIFFRPESESVSDRLKFVDSAALLGPSWWMSLDKEVQFKCRISQNESLVFSSSLNWSFGERVQGLVILHRLLNCKRITSLWIRPPPPQQSLYAFQYLQVYCIFQWHGFYI